MCGRSDNGITNGIEVFSSPLYGGPCVMTSNNDSAVRECAREDVCACACASTVLHCSATALHCAGTVMLCAEACRSLCLAWMVCVLRQVAVTAAGRRECLQAAVLIIHLLQRPLGW